MYRPVKRGLLFRFPIIGALAGSFVALNLTSCLLWNPDHHVSYSKDELSFLRKFHEKRGGFELTVFKQNEKSMNQYN